MNTEEPHDDYGKLTHQQQRFCDLYLTHFNAFKAAVECGYSQNTSRKGALLHVPKIQRYLKEAMNRRSQRLEITHDMILRELSKIAFSNMGNYYDEYGCLKRMNELTVDEKGAISYYDIVEIQDAESFRVGTQSRIKLHNKMSALDKIARHLDFYGLLSSKQKAESEKQENESSKRKAESEKQEEAVVDRSSNNLPMDYPVEDFELEGIELKTLMALEGVDVSPGRLFEAEESPMSESPEVRKKEGRSPESGVESLESEVAGGFQKSFLLQASAFQPETENVENILTISPLVGRSRESRVESLESGMDDSGLRTADSRLKNALGMAADTGLVAKACAV
jgi:phage terminase small subunit